ncbi:MAG: ribonuclease R family protein, partial [Succinivibrio sp.]
MNSDKNKTTDTIKSLLKLKNAPKGDVSCDFETALYLVAAIYHLDFSKPSHRGMCSHLFGSIGFKGDLSKYTSDDYTNTLKALVEKGALVKQGSSESYIASGAATTFVAKVRTVADNTLKDSFGEKNYLYVISDDSGNEYRLNSEYVVLPNDEVEVSVSKNSDVAFVNRITKVRQCILGRIMLLGKKATLMPDEPNLKQLQFEFESKDDLGEARSGDVVIAQITRRCSASLFTIKTREVVHDIGNLNNIIVMAVLRNDIPNVWPDNLIKSLSRIPDKVSEKETEGRTDLRTVPLMTIDGEDARDFDDAVYCKKEGNTFRLFVSIADVSTYVKPGTLLDKEAVNRCNSCYFPNYVIPMLPEKLSNGICSLNPDVDRLCMTCEMIITEDGKIKQYRFYPAVMRSHARLTYTEAWQMISEGTAKYKEHEFAIPLVKDLYDLYKAFLKNRRNRGAMSIESQELHFVFDENMEIEGVAPLDRNDAHKLIEECMIAANVAAAEFVCEHKYHTLYRIHPKPTEKKLAQLESQLSRFGLFLTGGDEPSPKDFMKLSDIVAKREDAKVINEMILRGMSKAQYHPDNIGHYGLALEKYAHFTSPIRRYADLQLHRVIKYILEKETEHAWGKIGSRSYTKQELVALGAKCTDREIAADVAEREVDAALACIFMEKFIGETVEG